VAAGLRCALVAAGLGCASVAAGLRKIVTLGDPELTKSYSVYGAGLGVSTCTLGNVLTF